MRYCLEPGCPVKVPHGRCPAHTRQVDLRRGSQRERGYDRRWEHRRRVFLSRYPLCGQRPDGLPPVMSRCHDEGVITAATVVDHVTPHKGNRVLFDDELNWQSLCTTCHNAKTRAGL